MDNNQETDDSEEPVFSPSSPPDVTLDDINGLNEELEETRKRLLTSAAGEAPEAYRSMSFLLYGKSGSGKSRVLRGIAGELEKYGYDSYQWIESTERTSKSDAEVLEELIEGAVSEQPTTIVLDCFDDFLMEEFIRVFEKRMESARQNGDEIIVLASVDEEVLGIHSVQKFVQSVDITTEIEKPDIERRRLILEDRFTEVEGETDSIDTDLYDFDRLARETDRFGTDDIESVVRRAVVSETGGSDSERSSVTEEEIVEITKEVDNERLESIVDEKTLMGVDVPEISFDDVGGHEDIKEKLVERVQQALEYNDLAEELSFDFGGGILLHGPPGTGKTMLVRALANELEYTFIPINSAELKSGMHGPAETIPTYFYRAQRNSPSILFFDEFDSVGVRRDVPQGDEAAVNTLLNELDGIEQLDEVVVIAATNRAEILDPALLRPGRFDYHFEIDVPDTGEQAEIFRKQTSDIDLGEDVTPEWFSNVTGDLTGADIVSICERAVTLSTREQTPDEVDVADICLTRDRLETAYNEFEEGRLYRSDLESSPAFR